MEAILYSVTLFPFFRPTRIILQYCRMILFFLCTPVEIFHYKYFPGPTLSLAFHLWSPLLEGLAILFSLSQPPWPPILTIRQPKTGQCGQNQAGSYWSLNAIFQLCWPHSCISLSVLCQWMTNLPSRHHPDPGECFLKSHLQWTTW